MLRFTQADVSGEGTIAETLISIAMSPQLARLSVLAHRELSSGSWGGVPIDEPAAEIPHGGVCEGGGTGDALRRHTRVLAPRHDPRRAVSPHFAIKLKSSDLANCATT